MDILVAGIVFVFGTIMGSFLNVLIIRFNTGHSAAGRSGCMNCGMTLQWFHLIPIFSFVFQGGKCTGCGSKISFQYPVVEFTLGVLFVLSWLFTSSLVFMLIAMVVSALLVFIAVYDIYHTIIPNKAVYLLGVVALAHVVFTFLMVPLPTNDKILFVGFQLLSGLTTAAPLYLIWFVSRGRAMGFGDVKLAVPLGWLLGIYGGLQMLGFAFIVGAILSLLLLYGRKLYMYVPHRGSLRGRFSRFTLQSEIPFGPFLVAGFFLVYFLDADLLRIMETLLQL